MRSASCSTLGAHVPPILRQSHKTASSRVVPLRTTRGLAQGVRDNQRISRGTSLPFTLGNGAPRVEPYNHRVNTVGCHRIYTVVTVVLET